MAQITPTVVRQGLSTIAYFYVHFILSIDDFVMLVSAVEVVKVDRLLDYVELFH